MIILYHHIMCPFSRQTRVLLKELQLDFIMKQVNYWVPNKLLSLNRSHDFPILNENKLWVSGIYAITEYLIEQYNLNLMPNEIHQRCKIRNLLSWVNQKLYTEVVQFFIKEKLIKLLTNTGSPENHKIKLARNNLEYHLQYINNLIEQREFISSDMITISDISVASHLSIVDYFSEIIWEKYPLIKNWYCIIKSRPSFYNILKDKISGLLPPSYYSELDF